MSYRYGTYNFIPTEPSIVFIGAFLFVKSSNPEAAWNTNIDKPPIVSILLFLASSCEQGKIYPWSEDSLDNSLTKYDLVKISKSHEAFHKIDVWLGKQSTVEAYTKEDIYKTMTNSAVDGTKYEIDSSASAFSPSNPTLVNKY